MVDVAALLGAYDARMRVPGGVAPAGVAYELDGTVLRIVGGPVGRIRAPRDVGVTGVELDRLIERQRDYFRARGQGVEWKVRGHDRPADLCERLIAAGFVAEEPSSVLLGIAGEVAAEPVLPDGVVLRRVIDVEDLRRVAEHQTAVWGVDCSWVEADLAGQVAADPSSITVWVVEAAGRILCSAWSVYQTGTEFVAFLGGTTVAEWRGRGLYRATVVVRAREAVERGYRLLHVDASAASAPILRRCGFHEITTSTHYQWIPPRDVEVADYDPAWARMAAAAIDELRTELRGAVSEIEHIGSTAVPGLAAKPVIDLMASADDLGRVEEFEERLAALRYRRHRNGMDDRLLYVRHALGRRTHILHVVAADTWPTRNQRILRDYLRAHPAEAERYARLKQSVVAAEDYTRAKTALVQELTDRARAELGLPSVPVWEKGGQVGKSS